VFSGVQEEDVIKCKITLYKHSIDYKIKLQKLFSEERVCVLSSVVCDYCYYRNMCAVPLRAARVRYTDTHTRTENTSCPAL